MQKYKNNLSRVFYKQYNESTPYKRIIFTDPNIPTIMTTVNGNEVVGGDIDDLFMILDAVYNCDKTLFVIGGEKGTSQVRYDSLMQAFANNDLLNRVNARSILNKDKFVSMDDFINNYRHLIADCFIFCPINGQILDFTKKCFNNDKKVYMQGQNKLDFNVKMSYSCDCESSSEIVINNIVSSIENKNPVGFIISGFITPIDSLVSGTPIDVSGIIHPFIEIAKKTALAKALGLGGIKKMLTGFFICSDVSGSTLYSRIHTDNGYKNGLEFQTKIINKFGLPDIKNNKNELIGSKGNTSIPILNIIYGSEYGKNILTMLRISDGISTFDIDTFITNVFNEINKNEINKNKINKNEKFITNIINLLKTQQNNNQSLHQSVKIIIVIIFGYVYSICGKNLFEVFDENDDIKEFNRINVSTLTKDKEIEINKMFINLQLWDYVGFLAFNGQNSNIKDAFLKQDLLTLKTAVNTKLKELMNQIPQVKPQVKPQGTSFGGKRTKRNKRRNKMTVRKRHKTCKTYRRN